MKINKSITYDELKFLLDKTDFITSITNADQIIVLGENGLSDMTTSIDVRNLIKHREIEKKLMDKLSKKSAVRLCGCGCGQKIDALAPGWNAHKINPDKTIEDFVDGWIEKRDGKIYSASEAKSKQIENRLDAQHKPKDGKYAKMIREVYNNYPNGLDYMEIVELLYDGTINFWTTANKKNNRGLGASNLNDSPSCGRVGILKKWFVKNSVGKWQPIDELRSKVFAPGFQPFTQVKSRYSVYADFNAIQYGRKI